MTAINHAIKLAEEALRGRSREGRSRLRIALVAARRLILEGASDQAVMAALLCETTDVVPIVDVERLCGVRVAMAVASLAIWEEGGSSRLLNDEFALSALFARWLLEPGRRSREVLAIADNVSRRVHSGPLARLTRRVLEQARVPAAA